jgi:hypothetical protein
MKIPHKYILPITALPLAVSSANAATTLMQTDFNSLASGTVTVSNLNAVTTDGTWTLDTANATFERSGSTGDYALLADFSTGGPAPFVETLATVVLSTAADFSTNAVTWSFNTATRRTGAGKGLRYEFFNGGNLVASLDWSDAATDILALTGTATDTGTSAFAFLASWDQNASAARAFSAVFEGTNLDLSFGAESLSVTIGSSSIDRLVVSSVNHEDVVGFGDENKGVFLDNMTVTQIPEPSSALLGCLGLLYLLRRRY